MLKESIEGLAIKASGVYVDATFGGGGHSREILKHLNEEGRLFVFDQDIDAQNNVIDDPRLTFIASNFAFATNFLKLYGIDKVDGVLADLGVSSHQFDFGARGFSIRFDAPLDMRMDQTSELTAHQVVNSYSAEALTKLLYAYAELSNAPQWTEAIISRRKKAEINTTFELIDAVAHLTPESKKSKLLAQLFQGIRVEVNQELASLESFLIQLNNLIDTKGRLVVISYHSLEDRLVKRFIRSGHIDGQIRKDFYGNPDLYFKRIGRMLRPTSSELEQNNRARSAKMRIAEKV